jgi:type IV pilus assembly protein PilQ
MTSMFALLTGALVALGGPVTEVAVTSVANQTSVLIAVDGEVHYRDFTMEGPDRLVVDLMGARSALPRGEFTDVNRGGIVSIRTSQYSANMVRMVFVLKQKLGYTVALDPKGVRVNLDNPGGSFAPWSSATSSSVAAPTASTPQPLSATGAGALRIAGRAPAQAPPADNVLLTSDAYQQSTARHISISFEASPIQNVLMQFAKFSGKTIISGAGVTGLVTASIHDQPWDVALKSLLSTYGLVGQEDENGIIRVDNVKALNDREAIEPIITKAYRINYATAQEVSQAVQPLLTARGKVTVGQGTNMVVVNDIQRVQDAVATLLKEMDVRTPEVAIETKIIYVDRTDMDQLGVSYELKDSRGNQFNTLSSGYANGQPIPQNQTVVLLGGNSVAALGNAKDRLTSPSLSLLTSLVIGRHQLISFLDALKSVNLSDVQAKPQLTVLDNQPANIMVGADIPVRTIDAGTAGGGTSGVFPRAQVTTMQTGIILHVTPHVASNGTILLELSAERSSAELASTDVGFIKNTQQASTRVLVNDGETVMFAGMTQSQKTQTTSGIPLLMDLPLIGRFFQVKQSQTEQQDLIILVTPHVLRND